MPIDYDVQRQFPTEPTNPFLQKIERDLECAIATDARVLITGPGGARTGALAELIHRNSQRCLRRFLAVNCAAMPDVLLEAKLFGHVLGSVHSTDRDPRGLLEQAHGGTIFLANIGAIGQGLQSRLLQFLASRDPPRRRGCPSHQRRRPRDRVGRPAAVRADRARSLPTGTLLPG